jgi:hypothetical protein
VSKTIEAIRAARAAISPTPWFYNSYSAVFSGPLCTEDAGKEACVATVDILSGDTATAQGRKNAEFIADAPAYVDALLEMVNTAQGRRRSLEGIVARCLETGDIDQMRTDFAEWCK